MKTTKRILSLVLCFVMLVGLMPAITLNAEAAGTLIDAAIFCSDVHGNPSTVTSVFNGIKSADSTFNPTTASFVGDTQTTASSVTSAAQQVYSGVQCIYAFGNHDDEGSYGIEDFTGLSYGDSSTNYYIYTISENSMSSSSADTSGFTSTVSGLDKTKPLFIISHMPLHARRNDNNGAAAWYTAISAAAESMDIFFFWAHNHTGDNEVDQAAYYVAKNGSETISIEGGSTVTPNFTYANAGYIDPPNTPARNNVATAVRIYDDSVNLTVYNASGELSGTYAVNETVTRQFAGTTDSGDGDGGSTDETTEPTEGETTTETKEVYVLVDTLTNNGEYLIVNTNVAGSGYAMNHSSGTEGAAAVTIQESGDYIYIDLDDSTAVWTATTKESGFELMNGSYYLEAYGSTSAIEISTTQAYSGRYWVYDSSASTLGYFGGNGDHYVYYDGGFVSAKNSGSEAVYIYEKQTITVSSDGTVSGGSTEGGDSGEDDTTGGSTETVVGDGTYTTADDGSWQKVTFKTTTTGTETKTVYVLSSGNPSGNVLIANSATAGDVNLVANDGGDLSNTSTTVFYGDCDGDGDSEYYIELDDATNELWTVSGSYTFENQDEYLRCSNGSLSVSSQSTTWSYSSNRLSYTSNSGGGGNRPGQGSSSTTYYLRYNSGWTVTSSSSSASSIYFYVPTEVEVETTVETTVTYSVTASDIEHFYTADTTDTETVNITASVTDGAPNGTYAYEVMGGDDVITSISEEGVITFNGSEGTAQVKVSYTWAAETDVNNDGVVDANDTYTIWQVIDVTATSPYYTLDLHKAVYTFTEVSITEFEADKTYYVKNADGTYSVATEYVEGTTYYTASATYGDEITETVAIKGVEAGDTYSVWAVIKYYDGVIENGEDGKDLGDVDDTKIQWTSSDESIATVDAATGIITFTGKEGTVQITAAYLDGNKPSDTVTISVTQSQYTVPNDGTTDFPEYPNEGAIRFDKTATAVGNFSETGIAMVELSMTGVPYTKGSEIDVVLMLDITGSMTDVTISSYTYSKYARVEYTILASQAFVESIVVNEDGSYNGNRVGVYSFNSGGTYTLLELGAISSDDELTAAKAAIATLYDDYKSGGTPYDDGLAKVQSVLSAAKTDGTGNNRQQFAVFMTDGVPTDYEYVTGTTHANYSEASSIAGMLTSSDDYCTRDTDYYYEYYSTEMKGDGVTVYTVGIGLENTNSAWSGTATQCLNLASRLLNDISGPTGETTQPDAVGTSTLSKQDSYFFSVADADAATEMENVFTNIAVQILQAATDVTVEDKITDEYTMIFDIPTDTNYNHTISTSQEFYIEFLKYTLDENHERVDSDSDGDTYDDATSVTKLYLGVSNGTYYAATDASGTAYAAPVFAQSVIGEKGTLYYWTIDETYASKATITYTNSDDTYYFIPYGMEANEDGTAPDGWYNMTSGAYAYGTIDEVTNTSTDLVIATPYFVYNASTRMLYWTVDKLDTAEYALRYFLYLDDSATDVGETTEVPAATYPTNDHAYITYTNFNGNDCQQKFPIPQLTWNGAQVSYVFYLVNAAGQPINKSGQVVDFANAVFVTDVYTKAVVWNKGVDGSTGTGELSADWLADELLPDEYTIYDELAGFTLNVYEKADGTTIKNQFTIEGDTAANISSSLNTRLDLETTESTVSVVTTKVYNTKAGEKVTGYGTYYSTDTNMAGIDFSNVTVAFAVVWESKLVEDVVVVDYGLDVVINVVQNDLLQNTVSGIGVGNSAYGNIAMNTGVISTSQLGTAALTIDGNTISIENENAIRFHQGDMEFTAPVKFYYESPVKFYEDSEQKTGFMYSSVTVIPATTIYYEDSFLDLTSFTKGEDGTFTEDATSKWTTDGTVVNATQDQDRPGAAQISKDLDADNNYGYDSAYEELATHSLDSAAKINVDASTRGEATFTFYGTGFDVISMTSNTTGTLIVQLYAGASATGTAVKSLVVDTFYGYTQNADGEWEVSVNNPNALYQVPVMKMSGLTYGQYTVKIIAGYNSYFDNVDGSSDYDLYLDAVRIYDPTGVASGSTTNDTVSDAYVADGEGWPQYIELRNNIIAASNYTVTENEDGTVTVSGTNLAGAIFIDSSDATTSIADYVSYGPNNELYLAAGQSVSFALDQTNASIIADVQIAMKLGNGSSVTYEIYNAASDGTKSNTITGTLETATDLYYSIKDLASGTIVISNTSGGILSITNIKVTYTQNPYGTSNSSEEDLDSGIMTTSLYVDEEVATAAVMSLRSMPVYEPETTVPEETEPETTVPEETEPETTVPEETEPETTVPEETEPETTVPEETEPETTVPEETEPDTSEQVEEIVKKVEKIIKSIFGWLFG